ncbi:hypothetical protein CRI94_08635 [Longibacter salinarum]|uniref:DUF1499 domain-containing protein n=1 Tax=Longibacter salinarum TaxID=1850348 RepID=A0A2A8CXR3_9BACT|nr:DUF1499 domain-containing protein [Longibacter salinarum]PEN13384.1 hypothetical protein CRI94_08635 [Longibacter salinarum]
MPRSLLVSGILGVWLLLCSPSVLAQPVATSSPLQPCPDSPNCELTQRSYETDPDTLFAAAVTALDDLGPADLDVNDDARRAHAVYRVVLIFKDDVHIAVTSEGESGSTLHIRSASRVGHSDLGVNARRVERFFEALESALPEE